MAEETEETAARPAVELPVAASQKKKEEPTRTAEARRPRRKPWRAVGRVLTEIGIVTVGILIAFALNAWWQDRATRAQEQVHLRALATDLQQNVSALGVVLANEKRIMSSSQELMRIAQAGESAANEPLTDLFSDVFNSNRYEPILGAYEALLNSGGLTLIRDEALRGSLAAFATAARGRYRETWSDEQYFAFAREYGGRIVTAYSQSVTDEARERAFRQMLSEPRFREHLALRYYSERDLANRYGALSQQAEALLAEVRKQIRASD